MQSVQIIKSLYACNGLVAVLLYVPQIINIHRHKTGRHPASMVTFGGWSIGSLITTLYAWTSVKDLMFATISFGNLLGSGTVFCLLALRKFRKTAESETCP